MRAMVRLVYPPENPLDEALAHLKFLVDEGLGQPEVP